MKKTTIVSISLALSVTAVVALAWLVSGGETTSTPLGAPGVTASDFKTGSLSQPITKEACTLTDGTETTCFRIIVTGTPVDTKIGPFCPTTTSTTAEDSGIWLDGSKIYDADGQFIMDLNKIYGDAKWKLYDESGKVNVTDTKDAFQGAARPDVEDAYKYHCVEGRYEWTNTGKAVPISMLVPVTPMKSSTASTTQGRDLGVTINGLVIAASAPVDAILGAYTIAAFDDCGGHFNPIEGYHLHAYTDCEGINYSTHIDDPNSETKIIGYALDGVAVFAPLAHDTTIQLDECNGRTTTKDGYHYYAQAAEKNRVVKCFKGLTAVDSSQPAGNGPPSGLPPQIIWIVAGAAGLLVATIVGVTIVIIRRKRAGKTRKSVLTV